MSNLAEAPVFILEKGNPVYPEWMRISRKLAKRIHLPVSTVRAHLISEAQIYPHTYSHHGNPYELLLDEYRSSFFPSLMDIRTHILGEVLEKAQKRILSHGVIAFGPLPLPLPL